MHGKEYVVLICLGIFIITGSCSRIVGGRPVEEGEIPFQASLRRSPTGDHFCGGSLVTKRYVLTAAHCMYFSWGGLVPTTFIAVVAGQLDHPITSRTIYRNCTKIIIHPKFYSPTYANDVSVLEVDKDFPVHSIRISTVTLQEHSISFGRCTVSGWGNTDTNICGNPPFGHISDFLLATEVDIIAYSKCKKLYQQSLQPSMLCAGTEEGGRDACQGDSGGPLVCNGLQTGIVSTGCGCAQSEYPGLYTDVAKFYPWIKEIIKLDYIESTSTSYKTITYPEKEETRRTKITDATYITAKSRRGDAHIPTLWLPIIILVFIVLKLL